MKTIELIQQATSLYHGFLELGQQIEAALPRLKTAKKYGEVYDALVELAVVQEEVFKFRLQKILSEEHPYLPPLNITKLKEIKYRHRISVQQLNAGFLEQRRIVLTMLTDLSKDSWGRTGLHEADGHVTIADIVRRMNQKDTLLLKRLQAIVNSAH